MHCRRRRRRRKKLINQPNENSPTDTKTSYSHIKVVGLGGKKLEDRGVRDGEIKWGKWRNEMRDCGSEKRGGCKRRNKKSDDVRDFKGQTD